MKYNIALILVCLCIASSMAQNCKSILLGEVVDFHDGTPLASAIIKVTGLDLETIADSAGKFNFQNLCNGTIELEILHPDCKSKFVTIDIDGDTYQKITLEHHLEELEEVHVVGDKQKNTNSSQEEKLTKADLEKFSGKNLGEALKNITGVSSLNTGANIVKPVIQGLNGSRVLILNNNVRMQDMEWGEEHAPNVDINASQDISVIKGAAALEYGGDAIGGVIVLKPATIVRTDSLFGKTQLNLFSNGRGGNMTSSLVKSFKSGLYLKAQGSLKRLGDVEAPDYILSNTGLRENNISLNIGKRDFQQGWEAYYSFFDADIGILRASHIGNVDDLIAAINSPFPLIINDFTHEIINPKQEVTHHLAKATYYRRFEDFGKLNFQYDYQNNRRFEFDIRLGDRADLASIDLRLQTHTVTGTLQLDSREKLNVKMGLLGRFQNNFANPETEVRRLIPDYDKYDFGFFTLGDYQISPTLKADVGLRYDFTKVDAKKFYISSRWEERNYNEDFADLIIEDLGTQLLVNPVFDYHNLSITAGIDWQVNNGQNIRVNYALAQRAPNPAELFSEGLHHSAARIELGDLRFTSEVSSKISASYQIDTPEWGGTIAPYYHTINDFKLLEPTGVEFTLRGAFPVWSYRQVDANLVGIDVSLYKNWTNHLLTNHKFSWVQGTDETSNTPLINIPATNLSNSLSYSNEAWNNLTISLTSQYVFEQKRTPDDILVFSPQQNSDVLLEINTAPPAYHLLNLDFGTNFLLKNKKDLGIRMQVNNILNTNYRDYLNRLRYFADDLGTNMSIHLIYNY